MSVENPRSLENLQAPPVKRPRRLWLVGGIVLGALLLAGAGVAVFLLISPGAGRGPAEVVADFDRAYDEVDCGLFVSVTTTDYRESRAPTCADFETAAQEFNESFSDYEIVVDSAEIAGATATVVTTESWVVDGEQSSREYTYTMLSEVGAWRVDSLE